MRASELGSPPVTYEQYLRWPETNLPCEFVDGQPLVSPSPALQHQRAVTRLAGILNAAASPGLEAIVSPLDWVLRQAPLLVRQPDLVVVDSRRQRGQRLLVPPLLAVEVVSPTSRERDLVAKRRQYAQAGLDWYWLVDLDPAQVLVLRREGEGYAIEASAAGGEELTVARPFPVSLRPRQLL